MITKEEIIKIIDEREKKFDDWKRQKPERLSKRKLKQELQKWHSEIKNAHELARINDPLFPKDSLGTVYTFMNVCTAIRASYLVALVYIKKLEMK